MSTAVTASGSAGSDKKQSVNTPPEKGASGGFFTPYKAGEGYATRLGIMAILMAYVFFASHHWFYNWVFIRDFFDSFVNGTFLGFLTSWAYDSRVVYFISAAGVVALVGGGFALAYRYIYASPRSSEFLIKVDGELGKVTWPKIEPWFKPESQVWGATYVVLIVVTFLTLYVFVVDFVLQAIAKRLFYGA